MKTAITLTKTKHGEFRVFDRVASETVGIYSRKREAVAVATATGALYGRMFKDLTVTVPA